jgi:hypothetical protein
MNKDGERGEEMSWQQQIRDMLEDLITEYELPAGSLYLSDNFGQAERTRDMLISHSVCIWEPDYPPVPGEQPGQNKIAATIVPSKVKKRPDDLDIHLREVQEGDLHSWLPEGAQVLEQTKAEREAGTVRVRVRRDSPGLTEYIRRNTVYCIEGYVSKAVRFACCSRFRRCSDAGKCIHANKLYSKACMYRDHLEQGRVFYGKNRNTD